MPPSKLVRKERNEARSRLCCCGGYCRASQKVGGTFHATASSGENGRSKLRPRRRVPWGLRLVGFRPAHPKPRSVNRVAAFRVQGLPLEDTLVGVEAEHLHGNGFDRGARLDPHVLIQVQVIALPFGLRMEQGDQPAIRCGGSDVATLGSVTEKARVGEIVCCGGATVLFADDVVDLAAEVGVGLVDEAVFAKSFGAAHYMPSDLGKDTSPAQAEEVRR